MLGTILISDKTLEYYYLLLSMVFSLSIFAVSIIKNYYEDYFLVDFSEKIKISVITWLVAVFIQLILLNFLLIKINLIFLISWALIPLSILVIKYLVKIHSKYAMKFPIQFVGKYYAFNDHEIKMLSNKGFSVFFHDSFENFSSREDYKDKSIVVLNLSSDELKMIDGKTFDIYKHKIYKLDEFFEKYLRKIYLSDNSNLFNVCNYDRFDYFLKRLIDFTSVIILLPILLGIMIYMFLVKKIYKINDSMFYIQKRYGLDNRPFNIYKLRTMKINSESKGNTNINDPRIYPFAKIIRNLRLDEIPQILNILLGHMHLVGPRAEWVKLSDHYDKKITSYVARHVVKPGITGWAQISYPYGVDDFDAEQKLMYDMYYIKNWTIWLEIEVCFKTLLVILDKKGF